MARKAKVTAKSKAAAEESYEKPIVEGRSYSMKRMVAPPKKSRFPVRRLTKLSYILLPVLLVLGLVLYVYYQRYSAIIDSGLQGKVFERQSGIYAAPFSLRVGTPMRMSELIRYLQSVGYVQAGASDPGNRGRYAVIGNTLDILPSSDSMIDGAKAFPQVQIAFGPGEYGIQSIIAADSQQPLTEALVEPEQISAAVNQQREKRKIIEYKDLPPSLIASIVVIEDREFFAHSGVSIRGILRALFRNYEAGEVREGGSTITQQLVKGFFLTPERTFKRKLSEAYMSIILEQKLTKEQIMTMYCNQIYLGQRGGFSINGFGEAARAYFGKDVTYLLPHESALLAGIIRSPNYYSPYSHEDRARDRRNFVLTQLVSAADLTPKKFQLSPAEAEAAKQSKLGVILKGGTDASDAPYFVDYVMRQLDDQYGEDSQSMRSMRVYTTIDLGLQDAAYAAVQKNLPEIDRLVMQRRGRVNGLQVAMVAMNAKTGDVLAMVGGRDYANSQLNRATDAKRQPGSVFKPFVYAAALSDSDPQRRITPATVFIDEPHNFEFDAKVYSPGNFGDTYDNRPMSAREALARSKNVIAVQVAERTGFQNVANFAERAGLTKVPAVPSVALGVAEATPLQMTSAYTAFANRGTRAAPVAIRRITTKEGQTLFNAATKTNDVMSPQVSYVMTTMMQDVLDHGTGTRVRQMGFHEIAAGKTGSSRDAWFAGYTKGLVCVVWIGFDDNTDVGVTGGATAALIWGDFMMRAMQIRPDFGGPFELPAEGLITLYVDPVTGQPARTDTPGARSEIFLSGTQPGEGVGTVPTPAPIPYIPPPQTAPPSTTERAVTTPAETTAPRNVQPFLGGGSDAFIPLPPAALSAPAVSQAATPAPLSAIRSTTDKVSTPTPLPRTATPKPAPKPTPGPKATQRAVPGPTPWPTPKFIAPAQTPRPQSIAQAPKPQPTIIIVGKAASDAHTTRPRVVPTPAPTPKQKSAAPVAKAKTPKPAAGKTIAAKPGQTQLAKAVKPPASKLKPVAPTPTPTPKPVVTPAPVKASSTNSGNSGKTFSMDVCSVSGLIPVKGLCKTVRRQFHVGQEPTKQCSAANHSGH